MTDSNFSKYLRLAWEDYEKSVHVEILDHWILLVVGISLRSIVIYDSFKGKPSHDELVDKKCSMVAKCLPYLLQAVGEFDGMLDVQKGTQPFSFRLCESNPQQSNGTFLISGQGSLDAWSSGDCGIFIIKYAEFFMSDKPVSKVIAKRMEYFRHKLACELYHHGLRKYEEYAETDRDE
ncbi:Ulp1 protease family, C-terminal catalytic domain containing protein [Trema orientale]|uniref:Ulp1 protease family, C-terminal catalytic domain containing protein n=1 Tax=Trema orientale TaxID=63057 RepID=A0A2P5D594_TREOI|nr:Ulp1 protease family, C-terminal catalytic domain containing protein [Trema orientale]